VSPLENLGFTLQPLIYWAASPVTIFRAKEYAMCEFYAQHGEDKKVR